MFQTVNIWNGHWYFLFQWHPLSFLLLDLNKLDNMHQKIFIIDYCRNPLCFYSLHMYLGVFVGDLLYSFDSSLSISSSRIIILVVNVQHTNRKLSSFCNCCDFDTLGFIEVCDVMKLGWSYTLYLVIYFKYFMKKSV